MSIRPEDVRVIYETTKDDAYILPVIDTACVLAEGITGIPQKRIDKIVLYLTAHLLVLSEENGGISRSKMGDADESYVVPFEQVGLNSTRFGQLALNLDPTGKLAAAQAGNRMSAQFRVVKECS